MSRKLEDLDLRILGLCKEFLNQCELHGYKILVTHTKRTLEEQQELYDQGRTKPGKIVTKAKPGQSPHNYGFAFDIAILNEHGDPTWPDDEVLWKTIGYIGTSLGLRWGGEFGDRPHFELNNWKSLVKK